MKYIAYCTKGLESIVEKEIIAVFSDVQILSIADKRIIFETDVSHGILLQLRTVDDIGIFVTETKQCNSLEELEKEVGEIDLAKYRIILSQYRKLKNTFSITASVAGSVIKPKELLPQVAVFIHTKYKWEYVQLDHANFDIRIFIDKKYCAVSIRLTKESLHHRKYKIASRIGSLKPSIAAAMVLLATRNKKKLKIVDDFCGSGTILCEAREMGNEIFGGDKEAESVLRTRTNLMALKYNKQDAVRVLDGTHSSWPNNYFDCAISNLPWGKQIEITSITDLYRNTLIEYKRIVKTNGSICLLVSKPELLIKYAKKTFPEYRVALHTIGLLGQNPTIVLIAA